MEHGAGSPGAARAVAAVNEVLGLPADLLTLTSALSCGGAYTNRLQPAVT
jgi:hypothetical protein